MKKTEIMTIIRQHNLNRDIKWNVLENSKDKVIITNDYDSNIRFEIRVEKDGECMEPGETFVDVVDVNCWQPNVTAYLVGKGKFWFDYENVEDAKQAAVKAIVRHFYYYY